MKYSFVSISEEAAHELEIQGWNIDTEGNIDVPFRHETDGEGGWNYFLPDGTQFWADQEGNLELGNGMKEAK